MILIRFINHFIEKKILLFPRLCFLNVNFSFFFAIPFMNPLSCKVVDANLEHLVQDVFLSRYGIYYLCDRFIITEMNSDITFDITALKELFNLISEYYGVSPQIALISNRINNYAVIPTDWDKVFAVDSNTIHKLAIVAYNDTMAKSAALEKGILSTRVKQFNNLPDAIDWVL